MAQKWSQNCQKRPHSTSFPILFYSKTLITTTRIISLISGSTILKGIEKRRKNSLNVGAGGGGGSNNQPTSFTILKQKALDVFQSQLSHLLEAQKTLTPKISLWPHHISPNYSGKRKLSHLEICILLKKGSSGRNEQ